MVFFALGIIVGLGLGWGRGGRLAALGQLSMRSVWILAVAVLVHEVVPYLIHPVEHRFVGWADALVLYGGLLAFLWLNRHLPGAYIAMVGTACNGVASLLAGGAMPVWANALGRIPPSVVARLESGTLATHVIFHQLSGWRYLGDILALPRPLPSGVVSFGDILLSLSFIGFLAIGMTTPRRV